MFIDLLNSLNYISFNIDAARIFGLSAAVYCAELLNVYKKATIKNKLINGSYFKVDRKFICNRTTLTVEEQLKIDINLGKIDIIVKDRDNPDIIKFDVQIFASILSSEDASLIKEISKNVKVKNPKGIKETKRQIICNRLKDNIQCSNYELLTALRNWVDAIFSNPSSYLSKNSVELFQNTLNQYTQGDLDLALRLVQIAIAQGYKDCSWAINIYEKDEKYKKENTQNVNARLPRTTIQKKVDKEGIGKDIF